MHSGSHLDVSAGTAASKWGANSAQHPLIDENETRLFGLSRLDQSFLKSTFSIAYYTPEGEVAELAFAFDNGDASRFFETEIQAATGLPIGKVRREAKDFKWKESDFPSVR